MPGARAGIVAHSLVLPARVRRLLLAALPMLAVSLAGCPQRGGDLPPQQESEPPKEQGPSCGKVFRDPKVRGGSGCCAGPAAEVLTSADIQAACGAGAATYAGETRDGAACRYHFRIGGGPGSGAGGAAGAGADPKETMVMVSRPVIPPGSPAPVGPDPLLPWSWKKVALRDAIGFQATSAGGTDLLERQTVLWAGRGRRIVGLHVSKRICADEAQAHVLLQKAIDAPK